jgi:hypothetical protein
MQDIRGDGTHRVEDYDVMTTVGADVDSHLSGGVDVGGGRLGEVAQWDAATRSQDRCRSRCCRSSFRSRRVLAIATRHTVTRLERGRDETRLMHPKVKWPVRDVGERFRRESDRPQTN